MINNAQAATMNNNLRRTITGKVELYNGGSTPSKTFLATDNLQEITVTRTGEKGKFFGFGICQKATVKIIDINKDLSFQKNDTLQTHFSANSGSFVRVCPSFFIKEAARDNKTQVYTITAYDALDLATAHVFSELNLVAPYTLNDVSRAIAGLLGLSFMDHLGFDLSFPKGANLSGNENLRTVLNAIAEATQTIYIVGEDDSLHFRRLSPTVDPHIHISKQDYFELTTAMPVTLNNIVSVTELGDNVGAISGVVQYVRDNPFWTALTSTGVAGQVSQANSRLSGLTIVPYNLKWRGNFLTELGDKCTIETDEGTITTYIIDDSFTYNGGFSQTCSWEYTPDSDKVTASNPVTLGEKLNQTFAKVDKIEQKITLYVSDALEEVLPGKVEEALGDVLGDDLDGLAEDIENLKATTSTHTENISQLQVTSTSINNEVSTLKETTTTISNEMGEVVASQETVQNDMAALRVQANQVFASVNSVEQKVTTLNTEIDNVSDQTNSRIDTISSEVALKLDKTGVEIAVDRKLEEGVDKVVTSGKKYKFDDNGLDISATDSNINTTITENGMRIYRSNKEVLVANDQGVKAQDLHAYTFLIIGENSRMEDRGNRTACFWIGPAGG